MHAPLKISHHTSILVADARKAMVFRNDGDALKPRLTLQQAYDAPPNPATHEQGSDRPPRVFSGTHRSAIEQTDWHDLAERRFAAAVAARLEDLRRQSAIEALVVIAPPRMLAELRQELSQELKAVIKGELDKDLTKHAVPEIERLLSRDT